MSTKFGIPIRQVDIELGDENGIFDYINENFFEHVALRDNSGKLRWYKSFYESLPNDLRVYALDNSQQGINTIGDIKKEMNDK
jgi:hypothetical protein